MLTAYLVLFAFIIFLNFFFFHYLGSVGITLILTGFFAFQLFLSRKHISGYFYLPTLFCSILFFIFSFSLIIRSYLFVNFISVFSIIVSVGIWMVLVKDRIPFFQSFFQAIFSPVNASLSYLQGFFSQAEYVFKEETAIKMSHPSVFEKARPFLIGLALSIPVLFVLISLFSSADPIYGSGVSQITRWFGQIFTGSFWKTFPARIIPSLVLTAILFPFIGFYSHKKDILLPFKVRSLALSSEISVVLFAVIAVITSFLFVQWRYIFVNVPFETDLSGYGVKTYSEYVTRGFFELILISLIVYSLTWSGLLVIRGTGEGKSKLLKILQIVLLSEFVILLFSMFRRIWLYQESHGWSLVRIYGGIFLVYLSILTLTLFLRHFKKYSYIRLEMLLLALGLIFTVFFNAEKFIVDTHPPTVNKNIDYVYLSQMSTDGYDGWKKSFEYAKGVLNDPEIIEQTPINKENRRKIAYSGVILKRISYQYDRLVRLYGSPEELRDYYISLYEFYRDDPYAVITPEPLPSEPFYQNPNWKKDWFNQNILNLREFGTGDDIHWYSDSIIQNEYMVFPTFTPESRSSTEIHLFDRYYPVVAVKNNTPLGLDRAFLFNISEHSAYEIMKKDIPIQEILNQIRWYRWLSEKIMTQGSNQQLYDIDISTNSPLL